MAFHRIFRCPFCRRGEGELAIDVAAIVTLRSSTGNGLYEVVADDPNQSLFTFNPDGARQEPCTHLVSFYIDGQLVDCKQPEAPVKAGSTSVDWDHSWLKSKDGKKYEEFLWGILMEPPPRSVRPSTPYRIRRIHNTIKVKGTALQYFYTSYVIVALDPRGFFQEFPSCRQRWVEYAEQFGG